MAFGKWTMRFCGVIFLLIGVGSLVVALVPSLAERFVESAAGTSDFGIGAAGADTVRATCWILAASFIPGAFLFFWVGQWFKAVEPSFDSILASSAQMARTGSGVPTQEPPDPTAGGIIS